MKKILKIIGIIVVGVVLLVLAAGLFIPNDYHFERDIIINAPPEKVWTHVNSFREMERWNPWSKRDPNIKIDYEGQDGAVGAVYKWKGNSDVGSGVQTITDLQPLRQVNTHVTFIEPFAGEADIKLKLDRAGSGTKATWSLDSRYNYPMNVMTLFMEGALDKDFTAGLNTLKQTSEGK